MVIDMGYWTRVIKNLLLLIISLALIFVSFKLAIFYIPFLIGFLVSVLIEPIIKNISKLTKWTRKTSAIIVVLVIFSIIIGLIAWGIISVVTESSDLLASLNVYAEKVYNQMQHYIKKLETNKIELPTQVIEILENSMADVLQTVSKYIANLLTNVIQKMRLIPIAFIYVFITVLSTYFICTDRFYILDQMEHHFPKLWVKKLGNEIKKVLNSLGNYLKAEFTLVFVSFLVVLTGLYIGKLCGLNIAYPLLSALGIAFVDALPILGSGTVMIPWAVISALDGNITLAITIFGIYILMLVVRQITEPKIVSEKIGIHPIFTLLAMYTGFKFIGILGLFIGPIVLIILKNIYSNLIEDGIVKSIFNRS